MKINNIIIISLFTVCSSCMSFNNNIQSNNKKNHFLLYDMQNNISYESINFENNKRYHSAFITGNPYIDGRNYILDGDYQSAINTLSFDIQNLDYPDRAALWVFLCYTKLGNKEKAIAFINDYIKKINLDLKDNNVIKSMILFYHGSLLEDELLSRMRNWDIIDNCVSYYYYGSYKKYYEKDYIKGNEYISAVLKTNIYDYCEYKFSEKEIKRFTARYPGQYENYPKTKLSRVQNEYISNLYSNDNIIHGSGEYEGGVNSYLENAFLDNKVKKTPTFPDEINEGEYIIPTIDNIGWEICDEESLLNIIQDEAIAFVNDITLSNGYLVLEDEPEYEIYPLSNTYKTFAVSFINLLNKRDFYVNNYKIKMDEVSLYLKEGDFLSGVIIPCRVYNSDIGSYEESADISISLLFSVNDDKSIDLIHTMHQIYSPENINYIYPDLNE